MQDKIIDISDEEIDMIPTHTDFSSIKPNLGSIEIVQKY